MKRRVRWFSVLIPLPLVLGCAMLRGGTGATDPGSSFGPCGSWVDCGPAEKVDARCCPPTMACAVDDGGPYCAASETYDPTNPVTWGRKERNPRSARGE